VCDEKGMEVLTGQCSGASSGMSPRGSLGAEPFVLACPFVSFMPLSPFMPLLVTAVVVVVIVVLIVYACYKYNKGKER
jgi:hypothetical protein